MTDVTFATPQDALDSRFTNPFATVYVGGVTVDAFAWDAQFDVDSTATAKLTVALPRPAAIEPNAVVEIQGGHNGLVGTLFSGRIPAWRNSVTSRGLLCEVRPVGWTSLLAFRSRFDLVYDGPITIAALFDSLCARMGVPSYVADDVTDPTGTITITLGGNPQVNEGKVTIPANQTPLSFLRTACKPFGYRIYDTPSGVVRLSRVSGLPAGDPVVTFTEGVHPFSEESWYDISGIVNYPDIHGPTYEDEWGASIPIRAFPGTVEASSLIPVNEGVSYQDTRNSMLDTQQLAEVAMAVALIDGSEPDTPVSWNALAVPGISVGDAVVLDAETIDAAGAYWLTSMDINSSAGLTAKYDGWAGAGEALPAGNNRTTQTIQTDPLHLGNEYEAHYAHPAIQGTSKTWNITIAERATAVNVRGLHHGTNSQLINGVNTDLEVTKWQVWLPEVPASKYDTTGTDAPRPEASGNMPIVNENLLQRLNYNLLSNWQPFAINLGRLEPGDYVLRLVSGVKAGPDDFEVRDVILETFGIAEPVVVPQEQE
jgi:hypothetical protein